MMEQYFGLKEKAGECLLIFTGWATFRAVLRGAKLAAAALDIALTSRRQKMPVMRSTADVRVPVHLRPRRLSGEN